MEGALGVNPRLLKALAMVWDSDSPIRPRIDRVLSDHGQELL